MSLLSRLRSASSRQRVMLLFYRIAPENYSSLKRFHVLRDLSCPSCCQCTAPIQPSRKHTFIKAVDLAAHSSLMLPSLIAGLFQNTCWGKNLPRQRVPSTQGLGVLPCLLTRSVLPHSRGKLGRMRLTCSRGGPVVFLSARIPERIDARSPPPVGRV